MLLKRKPHGGGVKHFCKGVALSSFLTAVLAVSSQSAIADTQIDETITSNSDLADYSSGNIIVNSDDEAIYARDDDIKITTTPSDDMTEDGSINLNAGTAGHGVLAENNKTITVGSSGSTVIEVDGDNTDNTGDGINVQNGAVSITSQGSNTIHANSAHGDGIILHGDNADGSVALIAQNGNNTIESGNNGVDNYGAQTVTIKAENGLNKITTIKQENTKGEEQSGDGLRIDSIGTGNIELTAQGNIINAEDAGLNNSSANNDSQLTLTATNGGNFIYGQKEAVLLGGLGKISVTSGIDSEDGKQEISLLAEVGEDGSYEGFNNAFIGGENGIHASVNSDGIFEANAKNNNYISGSVNGIWTETSEGSGPTINITAANDNIIGFTETITDDEGKEHQGQIGQYGIKVESGGVNLTAGNSNIIKAISTGIYATGENTTVTLQAKNNIITVDDSSVENPLNTAGVYVGNGADYVVNKEYGSSTSINVNSISNNAYGILSQFDGNANINTGNFSVYIQNVASNSTTGGTDIYATYTNQAHIGVNADSSINITAENNSTTNISNAYGVRVTTGYTQSGNVTTTFDDSSVTLNASDISINSSVNNSTDGSPGAVGISLETGVGNYYYDNNTKSKLSLIATGEKGVSVSSVSDGAAMGIHIADNSLLNISASSGDIYISAKGGESFANYAIYANSSMILSSAYDLKTEVFINGKNNYISANGTGGAINAQHEKTYVDIKANIGNNIISSDNTTVYSAYGADVIAEAKNGINSVQGMTGAYAVSGNISLTANQNIINSNYYGLYALYADAKIDLIAANGNEITDSNSQGYAMRSYGNNAKINIYTDYGANIVSASYRGLLASSDSEISLFSTFGTNQITADNDYAIFASDNATVKLTAGLDNILQGKTYGIAANSSLVQITADSDNLICAGDFSSGYGTQYAVYSYGASNVALKAGNANQLFGAVYARGSGTDVFIGNTDNSASKLNEVYSNAYIGGAGDLPDQKVISALYAEEGAEINLVGDSNILRTYAVSSSDDLERVVWAYKGEAEEGAKINITGQVYIATDSYSNSVYEAGNSNSKDIAVVSGTASGLEDKSSEEIRDYNGDRAEVNIKYTGNSYISGDILSAYAGETTIQSQGGNAKLNIEGSLLAGNNGIVNVDLGNGGILTGRADDYGDAGVIDNTGHGSSFFNPAFSSEIKSGGQVNLTMGEGSRWNVTGQSWITRINTENSSNAVIDLVSDYNDRNAAARALTIYELTGNARFEMSLDANRDASDMLYIKNANGNYTVNVLDAVSHDDMYANDFDGLRFATVGIGSQASFRAITEDIGSLYDIEYTVGTDSYANNEENKAYNGETISSGKPGNDLVDGLFNSDGEPGATTASVQTLAITAEANTESGTSALAEENADTGLDEVTNFKLIGVESSEISDAGKTVVDMSRANYANAVYMDTLNKRQGEARFVGDTDHGVWVRLRHDNIGKDDSFRSHNTMVEVGFEQRDVNDYGEFHTGFALDYMNGSLDYHTVDGDGDIERYGVWFYTTFLGNDGQYADLVLKYGHLKNDFDFNLAGTGVNVNGDYTNEVASISAEYGWKFSNSYNYYIEPQAQLQYSYVTGADYTTSYGTKVDLDSIHSLIGRVGFRAGKDFNTETPITAYIRGDVLHEFLGDQDIYAYDNTGVMDVTYENDDTWYSAGVGLSVQSSENTYFFIEGEQVFGADNDNTYTVSGGFKHSF